MPELNKNVLKDKKMLQPDYDQLVANGEETGMAGENRHLIPLNWGH